MHSTVTVLPFSACAIFAFFGWIILACFLIVVICFIIYTSDSLSSKIRDPDLRAIDKPAAPKEDGKMSSDFVWARLRPRIPRRDTATLFTQPNKVFIYDALDSSGFTIVTSFTPTSHNSSAIVATFIVGGVIHRGVIVGDSDVRGDRLMRKPGPGYNTLVTPFYRVTSRFQPMQTDSIGTLTIRRGLHNVT